MKLSKKDRNSLESVLINLNKAQTFIMRDTTIVAIKSTTTAMPENKWINKASLTGVINIKRPDYTLSQKKRLSIAYSVSTATGQYVFRIGNKEVLKESKLYNTILKLIP